MSDLISRQAILTELNDEGTPYSIGILLRDTDTPKDVVNKTLKAYSTVLIKMVNELPVAYDVEKVVEKIKSASYEVEEWNSETNSYDLLMVGEDEAIEIVRGGGKE